MALVGQHIMTFIPQVFISAPLLCNHRIDIMRRSITVLMLMLLPTIASAQDERDSLLVETSLPQDEITNAVVAAMTAAGLSVTDTSPASAAADIGMLWRNGYGLYDASVRVAMFRRDSSTFVIIRGFARNVSREKATESITRGSKGPVAEVWQQMVRTAEELGDWQ